MDVTLTRRRAPRPTARPLLLAAVAAVVLGVLGMHALLPHGTHGTHGVAPAAPVAPVAADVAPHTSPAPYDEERDGTVALCAALVGAAAVTLLLLRALARRWPGPVAHVRRAPRGPTRPRSPVLATGPPAVWAHSVVRC